MNRIREILKTNKLADDEIEFYIQTSRPTLLLKLDQKENYEKTGNSRIGGWPDLPKGFQYPTNYNGELYVFLAQLNLLDVTGKIDVDLPNRGILYFFLISDEEDSQNIQHLVWYAEDQELINHKPDSKFEFCTDIYDSEFPAYKLNLIESKTIDSNHYAENHWQNLGIEGILHDLVYPSSRIGGHSYSSEGDVRGNIIYEKGELEKYERILISKGYPFNGRNYIEESNNWIANQIQELKTTKSISRRHQKESIIRDYKQEQKAYQNLLVNREQIKNELQKWKLLLSIDSIDEMNMCWWDSGSLEFYINDDDLMIMDFTNTHCIINNAG